MFDMATRRSPIHDWLASRQPDWGLVGGMPIALRLRDEETEQAAMQTLGLSDLSGPEKLGVRGPDAESWLADQAVEIPPDIYESRRLADGGFIVRIATDEFLLESGFANESVRALVARLDAQTGALWRVPRQEATFLLVGSRALDVLSQTCGFDFHHAPQLHLVLTRVASVSCGVFPDSVPHTSAFRFWVDYTYAIYLWEELVKICEDLNGSVIGAGRYYA